MLKAWVVSLQIKRPNIINKLDHSLQAPHISLHRPHLPSSSLNADGGDIHGETTTKHHSLTTRKNLKDHNLSSVSPQSLNGAPFFSQNLLETRLPPPRHGFVGDGREIRITPTTCPSLAPSLSESLRWRFKIDDNEARSTDLVQ